MSHRLWQALEDVPGLQAAHTEWRERIGSDFPSFAPLLLPTDRFAASISVPGDPYRAYRVVWHAPDDVVGVDDYGGQTVVLSKQDLLIYRLDHQRVSRKVAAALGFESAHASVEGVPHTYRIGTFGPFAGFAFPAFLAIPLESADLQQAGEAISSQIDGPFIIAAPTRDRVRPAFESLLSRRKACFLALSEVLEVDGKGNWIPNAAASRQLSDFQRAITPQATDAHSMVFFPTPAAAKWSDVHIKFRDRHTVTAKVGDVSKVLTYIEMGMADGRNKSPTKRWELLYAFAEAYGHLTWDSPAATRKNQKRREDLARDLQAFFRIDGDPIVYDGDSKGWKTLFTIEA